MYIRKYQFGGPGYFINSNGKAQKSIKTVGDKIAEQALIGLGKIGRGFNTVATSGAITDYGQTSPFVDMDREAIAKSREHFQQKAIETAEGVAPYISPSNHLMAWTQGSFDPMVGSRKLSEMGPMAQLGGVVLDMAAFGKGAQTIRKAVGKTSKASAKQSPKVDEEIISAADLASFKKSLADCEQYIRECRAKGIELPKTYLQQVEKFRRSIQIAEANRYKIGTTVQSVQLPKALGPIYNSLTNSPHIGIDAGPYIEKIVGNNRAIIPIGSIKPSSYADYRSQRMTMGLKAKGVNTGAVGTYISRGKPVTDTPANIIEDATHRPSTLYISRSPNNTAGFYVRSTGQSYVKVTPDKDPQDIRLTDVHEGVSHGTDALLQQLSPEAVQEYQNLVTEIEKSGFKPNSSSSTSWRELRATLTELHKVFADEVKQYMKGTYTQLNNHVNDYIDKITYQKFIDAIEGISNYGKDYANYIRQHPTELGKFKKLVKYGLMYGAPVGVAGYGFINNENRH